MSASSWRPVGARRERVSSVMCRECGVALMSLPISFEPGDMGLATTTSVVDAGTMDERYSHQLFLCGGWCVKSQIQGVTSPRSPGSPDVTAPSPKACPLEYWYMR
jgi:hypothetical protein